MPALNVGSNSLTRGQNQAVAAWSLSHWTTREVPLMTSKVALRVRFIKVLKLHNASVRDAGGGGVTVT